MFRNIAAIYKKPRQPRHLPDGDWRSYRRPARSQAAPGIKTPADLPAGV